MPTSSPASPAVPSPGGHVALVVEDDDDSRDLLVFVLERLGCEVLEADTGARALELTRERSPDLVTLDLSLPDMDGTDVCREIREFSDAYILMVTGRLGEIDRLLGLEVGADDYVAKPFSPRELSARVAALLRRPRVSAAAPVAAPTPPPATRRDLGAGLVYVSDPAQVVLDQEPVPLTPAEIDLLLALADRPGQTWSRGDLVRAVWRGEFIESDFLLDVQVASVRRKLRQATGRDLVRTVAGAGYAWSP